MFSQYSEPKVSTLSPWAISIGWGEFFSNASNCVEGKMADFANFIAVEALNDAFSAVSDR